MAEFDSKTREIIKRLQQVRIKIVREQPFYAVLLMHLKFSLDTSTPTIYTDGERIAFNPYFIDGLSDSELLFVLMHEILHLALGHCVTEQGDYDHELFNIACDIIVNSNILYSLNQKTFVVGGEPVMHLAPDGKEGYEHNVHDMYALLLAKYPKAVKMQNGKAKASKNGSGDGGGSGKSNDGGNDDFNYSVTFDDHTFWKSDVCDEDDVKEENNIWLQRMIDAVDIAEQMEKEFSSEGSKNRGTIPLGAVRKVKELLEAQTDWRTILINIIQEEINDYSFSPPDRRFDDSPFFLPDFNEKEEKVKNIVFLVDTSASMSSTAIKQAFSEINGAIQQFNGKLEGFLACGDTRAYELVPINEETDIMEILPHGGGGTDFEAPIRFVFENMDEEPSCMIYITDGYCPFPDESITRGVPFLWLITNNDARPPWGKIGRIIVDEKKHG